MVHVHSGALFSKGSEWFCISLCKAHVADKFSAQSFNDTLECVSKRKIRKFEWILRQFKEETRRLSSAKSRVDDAEMAQKTPKLRIREFLRHTLIP